MPTQDSSPGRFTDDQIREMRVAWEIGDSIQQMAEDYGISPVMMGRIVRRQSYGSVTDHWGMDFTPPPTTRQGSLTDGQVREIRNTRDMTQEQLGERYGLSGAMIGQIQRRKSYRWVRD